ncbi:hypothetical protein BgiMline_033455 [Biomphalaria glabrata]|uniref:Transmembrane protein 233 n=1 Tax=Biomphalaria pfeifferi TaxID=112525 RepID=A0AAD8AYM4_BIOPF|nr:hypothetical protein BgiMline_024557 [Biomphalaria glabrata]KAI8761162.1 hypothetical protein BgiBS90_030947 [Biomphalaria glabrata]KAK0044831.1 hypothetical protein Bpfe_025776 [Biomphalaria pfeifferi]
MAEAQAIEVRHKSCGIDPTGAKNHRKALRPLTMSDKPGAKDINKADPTITKVEPIPQTNFAIAMLVMFCFNLPFGALALYFSLRAAAAYRDGDKSKGAFRSRASILLSLFGIMLTMVIVCSVVTYIAVHKHSKRSQRKPNASALGF